jgi:hypothetical protein
MRRSVAAVVKRLEIVRETRPFGPTWWYTTVVTILRRPFLECLILRVFWKIRGHRSGIPPSPPFFLSPTPPAFVRVTEPRRSRKGRDVGSRPFGNNPSRKRILNPSPEAVDPASRRWRRYAEAPAAAFLTDLRIAVGPASRLRRRYADAHAAAFLVSFLSMPAVRLNFFI